MHQTTIRFGPDTWSALERRAAALGVSAAQFVRDATLTRLAMASPDRVDHTEPELLSAELRTPPPLAGEMVRDTLAGSGAVRAQSELARDRSVSLRRESARIRDGMHGDRR
jgi:hypothetical protein